MECEGMRRGFTTDEIDAYVKCMKCNKKTSIACLNLLAAEIKALCKKVEASEFLSHFDPKGIGKMLVDRPWADPPKAALHKSTFLAMTASQPARFIAGCWLGTCEDSELPVPMSRVPPNFLKEVLPDTDPLVKIAVPVVERLESGKDQAMTIAEAHIIQAWPVVRDEADAQRMFKGAKGSKEEYGGARLGSVERGPCRRVAAQLLTLSLPSPLPPRARRRRGVLERARSVAAGGADVRAQRARPTEPLPQPLSPLEM